VVARVLTPRFLIMAILQAILALLSRSLGKVVTALFGWAVMALFGQTTDKQKTMLSALVAAAVLWPLLVMGIVFPRAAAFLVAFVPAHAAIPGPVMRAVWLGLALLIPLVMGIVVAGRAPPGTEAESIARRLLRGFPITVALAAAFLITFLTVPVLRLVNLARRREDVSVPAVTDATGYHEVATMMVETLVRHGFPLERVSPPGHATLPSRVLLRLGGKAFHHYVPERLEYFRCPALEVTFYPSGLLLRGRRGEAARAHALVDERLTHSPAVQTTVPAAQEVEREIRRVWAQFDEDPAGNAGSKALLARLDRLAAEARALDLTYADWQILYRELLQLGRALQGEEPLIEKVDRQREEAKKAPEGVLKKALWLAEKAVS
jgi:hypothetical protein